MGDLKLTLSVLPETLAICRLDGYSQIPDWVLRGSLFSVTRTPDELSIVCPQAVIPEGTTCDGGWRCLKVEGPLDLSLVGIMASLAGALAGAAISIFPLSTYETDYLLVKEGALAKAVLVLTEAGHRVIN